MNTPANPKEYYVFYCTIPNSTFIFTDGTLAPFTGGRYVTNDEEKAYQLNKEITAGNNHFYVNKDKLKVTEEELDPMAEYKAKVIADFLAKQAKPIDAGNYVQGHLNVSDSASLGVAAAQSDSAPTKSGVHVSIPKK